MIQAFAEAIRATTQPCTLLLVLPPIVMAVVTRGRWAPFAAICAGAVTGGWIFIANVVSLSDRQLQASGVAVAVTLGVLVVATRVPTLQWANGTAVQSAAAGLVTLVATMWWRPCVGTELGAILSASSGGLTSQLPGMAAYMLGAMVPVLAVVLVIRAIDPTPTSAERMVWGAGAVGLIVAGAMAVGRHDDLVESLTRWTLS